MSGFWNWNNVTVGSIVGVVFTAIVGSIVGGLITAFWNQIPSLLRNLVNFFQRNRRRPSDGEATLSLVSRDDNGRDPPPRGQLPPRDPSPDPPPDPPPSGSSHRTLYKYEKKTVQTEYIQIIIARDLTIWRSTDPERWAWVDQKDERFPEVAELLQDDMLWIKARIRFRELLHDTNYAAHLIFKTTEDSQGLDTFHEVSVSLGRQQWRKVVCLKTGELVRSRNKSIGLPKERSDGWMELELGQFYCDHFTLDQEVEVQLTDYDNSVRKTGLIVAGVEVRPI